MALVERDQPGLVIHTAAMTDVDGAARRSRAGHAPQWRGGRCAGTEPCARSVPTCFISTNEVFDGERTDSHGYLEDDATNPRNAYGRSKLAGEQAALAAYAEHAATLVRAHGLALRPSRGGLPRQDHRRRRSLLRRAALRGGRRDGLADLDAGPGARHLSAHRVH